MDKKDLAWVILTSVILLVLIGFSVPVLLSEQHAGAGPMQNPPQQPQGDRPAQQGQLPQAPPGQDEAKQLVTIISFVNIGLIIPLFIVYLGIYREVKSTFTLGLMAVIVALGMYAITSCPMIAGLFGGRLGDIGLFQILPELCTTIALLILVRISYE